MIDPYYFYEVLSDVLEEGDMIVTGNGTAFTVSQQALKLKQHQRLITNIGCASMGYGFPASIGVALASHKRTILLDGDGSFQMNIQELSTVAYHNLPIKMFIFNNLGYLAIRITQKKYFGRFGGIDSSTGIGFPSYKKLAHAYEIPFARCSNPKSLKSSLRKVLKQKGPVLCELLMPQDQDLLRYS